MGRVSHGGGGIKRLTGTFDPRSSFQLRRYIHGASFPSGLAADVALDKTIPHRLLAQCVLWLEDGEDFDLFEPKVPL